MKFTGAYIAPAVYLNLLVSLKRTKIKPPAIDLVELCQKFQHSGYEKILVTFDVAELLLKNFVLTGNQLCIAVGAKQYAELGKSLVQDYKRQGITWLVVAQSMQDVLSLGEDEAIKEVLYFVEKKIELPLEISLEKFEKLRVLFPYETKKEVFDSCLRLFEQRGLQPKTSEYLELWPLEEMSLWFDPEYSVLQDLRQPGAFFENSVVVPCQDNPHELKKMLKNLIGSLSEREKTEILIVDDSFEAAHVPEILEELKEFGVPSVYIKMNRALARERGDSSFRAGVSRNIGALLSRGQDLIFIDSDILIGIDFWEALTHIRQTHDGPVMPRRHFLLSGRGLENKSHSEFQAGQDTQLSWGGHWEDFYRDPSAELEIWKWTSTYCLAIPKMVFMKMNGFRRGFYCYGFEDTDLGYRLERSGRALQVMNSDVFHLPLSDERSEYGQDSRRRKMLLKKSFEVFMRSSLDVRLRKLFQHVLE